jgi:hypothetical protein
MQPNLVVEIFNDLIRLCQQRVSHCHNALAIDSVLADVILQVKVLFE